MRRFLAASQGLDRGAARAPRLREFATDIAGANDKYLSESHISPIADALITRDERLE